MSSIFHHRNWTYLRNSQTEITVLILKILSTCRLFDTAGRKALVLWEDLLP